METARTSDSSLDVSVVSQGFHFWVAISLKILQQPSLDP